MRSGEKEGAEITSCVFVSERMMVKESFGGGGATRGSVALDAIFSFFFSRSLSVILIVCCKLEGE